MYMSIYIPTHAMINKLRPNPLVHINTMWIWLSELVTVVAQRIYNTPIGSISLLTYICKPRVNWVIYSSLTFLLITNHFV
jgi:hypothetical protein